MDSVNFLTDMNTLFDSFFKFNDIKPPTTGIPQDKILGANTLANYLVGQNDKNETKGIVERVSILKSVATNKDSSVINFLSSINSFKSLYKSNSSFKTLVDFYVKQENFNRIRVAFFLLVSSQCKNTNSITDAKTLQTYIDDYLIPDINDQSTFTEQVNPMVDFMNSLLECMASVLNTPLVMNSNENTGASNVQPGAIVTAQRKQQSILNLNPNFYLELKTFIYKYLALFLCHIIVTFKNLPKNTHITTIPPESWGFILPYIADETTNPRLSQQQKTLLQTFVNNNSMSTILSLQYPDIKLVNDTMYTLITAINTKLQQLDKNDPKYTPLVSLKQKIQNECNALRQMLEYNLVRTKSQEIATNLVYFASYYFGPNKEIYQQTNTPFSETYLNTLLDTRIKAQTNFYLSSMSTKIATLSTIQDVHTNEVNDNTEYPKYIFTPTTKTTITKDNKNKDISTCLAKDMFPPDGQFAPIAKLMKAKAKSLNLEKEAKQMYDQILVDRSKCKATVNRLYSTTLSSMNATKWDKLGGQRTRRHLKQKKQKKAKKTQKTQKFKTRKQRKTKK